MSRRTVNLEAETFICDLFAQCHSEPQPIFLTLTAIHPDGDRPTPSRHVPLGNQRALERAVARLMKANGRGWGAYIGIAPRKHDLGRWMRGGKRDLVCLPALFVDIDQPEEALLRLGWFDLPASCIVKSGHGYHAYWFLNPPTVDFALADKVLRGLAQHLNGDEALTVAQSMRLPGTINTKVGRESALCSFVGYHPERLYDLSEFMPYLPKIIPYPHDAISRKYRQYSHNLPQSTIDAVTEAVFQQLDGHWRSNGFIAACCPFAHQKDRPGMHFSYHPESGWGYCFGKHGKIPPSEMCKLLGVRMNGNPPGDVA